MLSYRLRSLNQIKGCCSHYHITKLNAEILIKLVYPINNILNRSRCSSIMPRSRCRNLLLLIHMIIIFKLNTITVQLNLTCRDKLHSHTLTRNLCTLNEIISIIKDTVYIGVKKSIIRDSQNLLTKLLVYLHSLTEEWHLRLLNFDALAVPISCLSIKHRLLQSNRKSCTTTDFIQLNTCNLLYWEQEITHIGFLTS